MKRLRAPFFRLAPLATAAGLGMACTSGGSGSPSGDASDQPDAGSIGPDASLASMEAEADAPVTQLRVAALSPDLPAFDVCVALHGTGDYRGPLFAQLAEDAGAPADAAAFGLSYPQVSAYLPIDPGQYDVRIVATGAGSCATALAVSTEGVDAGSDADAGADAADGDAGASAALPDITDLAAVLAGTSTTLLVIGDVSPEGADETFRLATIRDDTTTQGAVSLRVVNAQPSSPALDFGFGSFAGDWTPLFTNVAFGSAGPKAAPDQGSADDNAYLTIAPFTGQTLSARLSTEPTGDAAVAQSASLNAFGSVATNLAIGGKTGDPAQAPALLLCIDNAPSGGALADCSVLP
jgi:hypothetical protein